MAQLQDRYMMMMMTNSFLEFFFFTTDVCYTSGSLLLRYIPPSAVFTTQVAACYCCIFLPVQYLLHKWQPVTAVYSSQCSIYYTSGSLLLLYIPPSALFAVVQLCPIINPTATKRHANNHNASLPLLLIHK